MFLAIFVIIQGYPRYVLQPPLSRNWNHYTVKMGEVITPDSLITQATTNHGIVCKQSRDIYTVYSATFLNYF